MNLAGLKIGHSTDLAGGTGVTVFLPEKRVPCGWWLCGSAPATRDVNLLDPAMTVDQIDALLFAGGSAYGLGATNGVMQWLLEQQRGYPTRFGLVPLVPTAGIYDFSVNGMVIPTAEQAYQACQNALANNSASGRVGVGTGASVGKWLERGNPMTGGFGYAQLNGPENLKVLACVVVNSIGDVINEAGQVVAGAAQADGAVSNVMEHLIHGEFTKPPIDVSNTTLVAIFTNASLSRAQLTRLSKMAGAGIARGTLPAFTRYDGDVVFSISLGDVSAEEVVVGALAASATHAAILKAVQDSVVIYNNKL